MTDDDEAQEARIDRLVEEAPPLTQRQITYLRDALNEQRES